jgi:membrane protease YdiL (CAAX protease family)
MVAARIELKTLLLTILSISIIEIIAVYFGTHFVKNSLVLTGGSRLLEILAMTIILIYGNGGLVAIGLSIDSLQKGLQRGIYWSFGFGLIAFCLGLILFTMGINPFNLLGKAQITTPFRIFLLFLVGGLIGPVAEEFFFRGILYGFFRRWGILPALILSTLIFVIMHPLTAYALTQTVGGIIFALAYEREQNLLVPITIHVLGNCAIFVLTLLV